MSITGLEEISATSIDNSGEFRLGATLNSGTTGQAILSQGIQQPAIWGTPVGHIANALTAGTNITLTSGNPSWDGSIADTINSTNTTYSAGNGIDLFGTIFSTDNDGTTINNTGGTGTQNQVLKVPQSLTINGTAYDGSVARAFTLPTAPIPNADLQNSSITLGSTPCALGSTETTIEDLELDNCLGITMDSANIDCDGGDITNIDDLSFQSQAGASNLTGNNYPSNPTKCTYLDLSSSTNIILPPNVYETYPGTYKLAFDQGIWRPNDDSSFYNFAIEDDFTAPLVSGRGKIMTSSLELAGFVKVPNGWRATKIYVDVRGSTGFQVSQSYSIYELKTWQTANPITSGYTSLGSTTTNTEYTLSSTSTGAIDKTLWIDLNMSSTAYYVGGGYLVVEKV